MFIFVHLIKMTIYLNMQKNIAQIRVHKRRPIQATFHDFEAKLPSRNANTAWPACKLCDVQRKFTFT